MGRKRVERGPEIIEKVSKDCFRALGYAVPKEKSDLFARLFLSGLSHYFFYHPDDIIKIGFLKLEKSPDLEELFKVIIQKSMNAGVINAETLWKYYTGELIQENNFKEIIEKFMNELIEYSQEQEINITQITNKIGKENKNGI